MTTKTPLKPQTPDVGQASPVREPSPQVVTITAEELCLFTGLTDRRHRQLAKEGYFPPPIKSLYQRDAALSGLFKYFREASERTKDLKEAISAEKLREAKRENEEAEELLVKKSQVVENLTRSMTPIREVLRQKLENELPMSMSGMGVPENRIIGKRLFDDLCDRLAAILKEWTI